MVECIAPPLFPSTVVWEERIRTSAFREEVDVLAVVASLEEAVALEVLPPLVSPSSMVVVLKSPRCLRLPPSMVAMVVVVLLDGDLQMMMLSSHLAPAMPRGATSGSMPSRALRSHR